MVPSRPARERVGVAVLAETHCRDDATANKWLSCRPAPRRGKLKPRHGRVLKGSHGHLHGCRALASLKTRPPRAPNGPLALAAALTREAQGPTAPRAIATRFDVLYSAILRWTGPSCRAQPLALPAGGLLKASEAIAKSEGCV